MYSSAASRAPIRCGWPLTMGWTAIAMTASILSTDCSRHDRLRGPPIREDRRIEIGKEAPVEGYADEQRCHVIADRTDVALRRCVTTHIDTQPPIPAGKIMFIDRSSAAGDDDPMSVRFFQGFEARTNTADQCGIKTLLLRRGYNRRGNRSASDNPPPSPPPRPARRQAQRPVRRSAACSCSRFIGSVLARTAHVAAQSGRSLRQWARGQFEPKRKFNAEHRKA